MKRILLVDLSQRFGGADIRVIDVARRLGNRFDLHAAVLGSGALALRLAETGVTIWPMTRSRRDPRMMLDLARLLRRLAPDVVDAHNPQSQLWGLAAARAVGISRRIATVHSVLERSETQGLRPLVYPYFYRLLEHVASEGVAVCESVGRHMRERGFTHRPLHVIANGIAAPTEQCRQPLGRDDPGRFRIAVVGRLVPVKGHAYLLRALSRLTGRVPGLECLIIGEGPQRDTLEQEARGLGLQDVVRFLGHRGDVLSLVADCDVLCMPSLTEGLPYAALEAATLSVPIVASAVGGLAEELSHAQTARLVAPADPDALAAELAWCAENREEARQLGAAAARMVELRFSMHEMIERTAVLYATDPVPAPHALNERLFSTARSPDR